MLPINNNSSGMLLNPSLGSGVGAASAPDKVMKDTYLDQNSLDSVKAMGRKNDPEALKQIAKKFEGMFVQQMLKSMREANAVFSEDSLTSGKEEKFHQDMLDQQMVLNLTSGRGIGLATSMFQQMQKMHGKETIDGTGAAGDIKDLMPTLKALPDRPTMTDRPAMLNRSAVTDRANNNEPPALLSRAAINNTSNTAAQTPEQFIASLMPFAEKAAADLKVNPDVILAQVALETGWGKHLLRDGEGNSSFNLFNIKTNNSWEGKTVDVSALEYNQGVGKMERSEFRQYGDYQQSFSDYVDLMKNSPRYQRVLDAGNNSEGYAEALQKAGYATDPAYAEKLKSLLNSNAIRSAVDAKATPAPANDSVRG